MAEFPGKDLLDNTRSVSVQVARSKVEVLNGHKDNRIFGAPASFWEPRSTTTQTAVVPIADLSVWEQGWYFLNTTDATLRIEVRPRLPRDGVANPSFGAVILNMTIPPDGRFCITPEKGAYVEDTAERKVIAFPELRQPFFDFVVNLIPQSAPTTGEVFWTVVRKY